MSTTSGIASTSDALGHLSAEERLALVQRAYGKGGQRESKYHARRCTEHAGRHASLKECRRYGELVLLERAGAIRNLRQQVPYRLCPYDCTAHGRHVTYVADFVYEERRDVTGKDGVVTLWLVLVEDTKGMRTPQYVNKRHLFEAKYGMQIREV